MEYLGDIVLKVGDKLFPAKEYEITVPDHIAELILSSSNEIKEAVLRDQIRFENYEAAEMLKQSMK